MTGATAYGINGSPTNLQFLLAFGDQTLAGSIDSAASWTDIWSVYRTFADGAFGVSPIADVIITAFPDLGLLYSRPITS